MKSTVQVVAIFQLLTIICISSDFIKLRNETNCTLSLQECRVNKFDSIDSNNQTLRANESKRELGRNNFVLDNLNSIELTQDLIKAGPTTSTSAIRSLYLSKSTFRFLYRNNTFDWICDLVMHDMGLQPLFTSFKFIFLGYFGQISYIANICPIVFKNSKIESIYLFNLSMTNRLTFIDSLKLDANLLSNLNSSIKRLHIQASTIALDEKILNKHVFKDLTSLSIEFSNLTRIQSDIFRLSFKRLSKLKLWLFNMAEFLNSSTDNHKWMKHLNSDVFVNDVKRFHLTKTENKTKTSQFLVEFYDESDTFRFGDESFCLFQHFPHNKLVFPLIKTNSLVLNCSCTLVWMFKYHRYSQANLFHRSVAKCNLYEGEKFEAMVHDCKLDERVKNCSSPEQLDEISNKNDKRNKQFESNHLYSPLNDSRKCCFCKYLNSLHLFFWIIFFIKSFLK
jgi:hypothetical protein